MVLRSGGGSRNRFGNVALSHPSSVTQDRHCLERRGCQDTYGREKITRRKKWIVGGTGGERGGLARPAATATWHPRSRDLSRATRRLDRAPRENDTPRQGCAIIRANCQRAYPFFPAARHPTGEPVGLAPRNRKTVSRLGDQSFQPIAR